MTVSPMATRGASSHLSASAFSNSSVADGPPLSAKFCSLVAYLRVATPTHVQRISADHLLTHSFAHWLAHTQVSKGNRAIMNSLSGELLQFEFYVVVSSRWQMGLRQQPLDPTVCLGLRTHRAREELRDLRQRNGR